jgi:hypothetical protein
MAIKDIETYRYIQNICLDEIKFTENQEIQIYCEIADIINVCKNHTETAKNKDIWNIPKGSKANKDLGKACRKLSIAAIWQMIKIMRNFDRNNIFDGPFGEINHNTMDKALWQKIENNTKTAVAERVGDLIDTAEQALFSSSYSKVKLDKTDCWQIGNEFAEVMGVKVPHPEKGKMMKNNPNNRYK